jgi:hypothetical protein
MFLLLFASPRSRFCASQFTPGIPAYVAAFHLLREIYHYRLIKALAQSTSSMKHQATLEHYHIWCSKI